MNAYQQMKERQQKEFDAFPLSSAFSNKQFEKNDAKMGLNRK